MILNLEFYANHFSATKNFFRLRRLSPTATIHASCALIFIDNILTHPLFRVFSSTHFTRCTPAILSSRLCYYSCSLVFGLPPLSNTLLFASHYDSFSRTFLLNRSFYCVCFVSTVSSLVMSRSNPAYTPIFLPLCFFACLISSVNYSRNLSVGAS